MKENLLRFVEYFNQQRFTSVEEVSQGLDPNMIPEDVYGLKNRDNDTLGRPTNIGDVVSYCQKNEFRFGILIGYTPSCYRVLDFHRRGEFTIHHNVWSDYSKTPKILVVEKVKQCLQVH